MAKGSRDGKRSGKNGGQSTSDEIKKEFMQIGLNSKFKGVKRDAENGTGNYYFKDYKAVGDKDLPKMKDVQMREHNGNTLVTGIIGRKGVVYGNKTDSKQIKDIKAKTQRKKEQRAQEEKENARNRPEIRTTSTYDRWKKRHDANFDAWFGKR